MVLGVQAATPELVARGIRRGKVLRHRRTALAGRYGERAVGLLAVDQRVFEGVPARAVQVRAVLDRLAVVVVRDAGGREER